MLRFLLAIVNLHNIWYNEKPWQRRLAFICELHTLTAHLGTLPL